MWTTEMKIPRGTKCFPEAPSTKRGCADVVELCRLWEHDISVAIMHSSGLENLVLEP